MAKWTTKNIPNQTGRVMIVTGANSGLGYINSRVLAEKGAQVVMACRNQEKGESARQDVLKAAPNADVHLMQLDLSDLDSVQAFAEAFHTEYDRLDVLFNNAGVMALPRRETAQGFEMQIGVNHLGHFALTGRLLDLLLATPESRIVTVSSGAHRMGSIDFNDLQSAEDYGRYEAYGQSKLANILFSNELQRRLSAIGSSTQSLAAHPGYSNTELQGNTSQASGSMLENIMYKFTNTVIAQSAEMGTLPQLYAGLAPEAEGGKYYGPNFLAMRGYPTQEKPSDAARDDQAARRLWEASEELTGVRYEALSPTPA